jgi:hypothetical protein
MTTRRTDDPDVCFVSTDGVALWVAGIVEWRIDRRNGKFLMTPIMRDRSEGPLIDATDMFEDWSRERRQKFGEV